jgi:hypothetical protein
MCIVDMADRMSTDKRSFSSKADFEVNGHRERPGGEAVVAGDVYLPGGWQADIRELSGACAPDRFASF